MVRRILKQSGRVVLTALALAATAVLLLHGDGTSTAQGGGKTSADKVKITATASRPDASGKQVVTLTLDVAKGWHLYANPVNNEDLDATKTVVTVSSKIKPVAVKVDYPPGTLRRDKTVGNYMVYEDQVAIRATVQRAAGDTGPLQVTVKMNACDEKACLPPGQTTIIVP